MPQIQVIARYTVSAGNEEKVVALLREAAPLSRSEPGNLDYTPYVDPDDPRRVVLLERYVSREAIDAHRETAHFQEIVLAQIVPLLEERIVELYEVAE